MRENELLRERLKVHERELITVQETEFGHKTGGDMGQVSCDFF